MSRFVDIVVAVAVVVVVVAVVVIVLVVVVVVFLLVVVFVTTVMTMVVLIVVVVVAVVAVFFFYGRTNHVFNYKLTLACKVRERPNGSRREDFQKVWKRLCVLSLPDSHVFSEV